MIYEYDFGDGWEHQITLLECPDPDLRNVKGMDQDVMCIAGEGHLCAEDSVGPFGWQLLKEAFKPGADTGRQNWYKKMCSNGERVGINHWK